MIKFLCRYCSYTSPHLHGLTEHWDEPQRHSAKVSECCGAEWREELGLHCPKCGNGTGFTLMPRETAW